jgi:Zn-dependent peptidase ImmA (M78 family)/transcriptional regulator with XRE-family HTH domain
MSTKGYSLARLREAREARCLSLAELAEEVGTSRQILSQYELLRHIPRPDTMSRLCIALHVPAEFFLRDSPSPEPAPNFFRHFQSKVKPKHLMATERQKLWIRDAVTNLEELVTMPPVEVPNFSPPSDPREIRDEQIEEAATALRRTWGFGDGAMRDIVRLVENKGCIVVLNLIDAQTDAIDSLSWWSLRGRPFIVIGYRDLGGARRRLDVAHELGHLILHRNVDKRFIDQNAETHRLIERQAFRFAGAFLMPAPTFRRSLPTVTLDTLLMVKPQWYLSIQAMLQRAKDLEMVDHDAFVKLRKNLARRWPNVEPGDEQLKPEQPQLLANALRAIKHSDPQKLETFLGKLGLYARDLERYSGLESGALEQVEEVPTFVPEPRDDRLLSLFP